MNIGPIIVPLVSSRHGHYSGPAPTFLQTMVVLHVLLLAGFLLWQLVDCSLEGRKREAVMYALALWLLVVAVLWVSAT